MKGRFALRSTLSKNWYSCASLWEGIFCAEFVSFDSTVDSQVCWASHSARVGWGAGACIMYVQSGRGGRGVDVAVWNKEQRAAWLLYSLAMGVRIEPVLCKGKECVPEISAL